jgi:hypothetical protein
MTNIIVITGVKVKHVESALYRLRSRGQRKILNAVFITVEFV